MTPKTPQIATVQDAVAAGLVQRESLVSLVLREIRCRHHGLPVAIFDGPKGGLCADCIAQLGPAEETPLERRVRERLGLSS